MVKWSKNDIFSRVKIKDILAELYLKRGVNPTAGNKWMTQ